METGCRCAIILLKSLPHGGFALFDPVGQRHITFKTPVVVSSVARRCLTAEYVQCPVKTPLLSNRGINL